MCAPLKIFEIEVERIKYYIANLICTGWLLSYVVIESKWITTFKMDRWKTLFSLNVDSFETRFVDFFTLRLNFVQIIKTNTLSPCLRNKNELQVAAIEETKIVKEIFMWTKARERTLVHTITRWTDWKQKEIYVQASFLVN